MTLLRDNLETILLGVVAQHGTLYGLQIFRAIHDLTGGAVKLSVGSLYPSLHKLALKGWLVSETKTPPQGGPPVVYYTLSEEGKGVLVKRREEVRLFYDMLTTLLNLTETLPNATKDKACTTTLQP